MSKDLRYLIFAISLLILFVGGIFLINTLMFQHSIYLMFGADIHWFLDFLGACVLNGLNLILFIICIIAEAIGFKTPFFDIN